MVRRKSQDDAKKSKKDSKTSKQPDEQESALEERDTLDTSVSSVSSVSDSDNEEIAVVEKQKAAAVKPIKITAAIAKDKPAAPKPPVVVATTSTSDKSKRKSAVPQKKIVHFTYALKEIKRLQSTTHSLIPRAPFLRLVKETIQKRTGGTSFRVTETAVEALREASENLLTNIFEDSYLLSLHARRVTLMPRDMQLLMRLKHADFFSPEDQS